MSLRVALVGCGAVVDNVVAAYQALPHLATVVAVVDTHLDRAGPPASTLGAVAYDSLGAALAAQEVDAVDIRVPHAWHEPVALEAIAAGKHVLVEKPLATTLEAGFRVVEAAEKAGLVLAVAENYSFFEPVAVARRLMDEGAVGAVMVARTHRVTNMGGVWVRDRWRIDGSVGGAAAGVLVDQGCHHANLLRRLVGEVTHVSAYAAVRHPQWTATDVAVVNCRLAEGGVAQQFYCWGTATTAPGAEATVYGVEGSIEIRVRYGQEGGGVVLFRPDLPPEGEWVSHAGNYHASFTPTVEDWLLACRGDKAPVMSGAEGLRDLAIVTAACASIEQGGEVAVR